MEPRSSLNKKIDKNIPKRITNILESTKYPIIKKPKRFKKERSPILTMALNIETKTKGIDVSNSMLTNISPIGAKYGPTAGNKKPIHIDRINAKKTLTDDLKESNCLIQSL